MVQIIPHTIIEVLTFPFVSLWYFWGVWLTRNRLSFGARPGHDFQINSTSPGIVVVIRQEFYVGQTIFISDGYNSSVSGSIDLIWDFVLINHFLYISPSFFHYFNGTNMSNKTFRLL